MSYVNTLVLHCLKIQDTMNMFEGCFDWFSDLYRWEYFVNNMQTTNHPCACEPCGCSVNPEKPSKKKARFTALRHVLMVMPVMSNVALVVVAANYSKQSHPCKSSTLHSFKATTDTQLTTFESLSTLT